MSANTTKNSLTDLKAYFSTEEQPVGQKELTEFWKSLSDEEKAFFRSVDLTSVDVDSLL